MFFVQIDMLSKLIRRIYGENIETLGGISRIVNKHHFNRLCSFLKDPMVGASIVHGGSYDEDKL